MARFFGNVWKTKYATPEKSGWFMWESTKGARDFEYTTAKPTDLRKYLIKKYYDPKVAIMVFINKDSRYDDFGELVICPNGTCLWHASGDRNYDKWTFQDHEIYRVVDPKTGKLGKKFECLEWGYHNGINWKSYHKHNPSSPSLKDLKAAQRVKGAQKKTACRGYRTCRGQIRNAPTASSCVKQRTTTGRRRRKPTPRGRDPRRRPPPAP